jgi:hypothetical protein
VSASMELCPYCGAQPKLDVSKYGQQGDGWSRISCWADDCEVQPTTGWFRDDDCTTEQARATWKLIAARDVRLRRNPTNGVYRIPEDAA